MDKDLMVLLDSAKVLLPWHFDNPTISLHLAHLGYVWWNDQSRSQDGGKICKEINGEAGPEKWDGLDLMAIQTWGSNHWKIQAAGVVWKCEIT